MIRSLRALVVVSMLCAAIACAPRPAIEQAEVERVLGTLAADDMEGRRAFTPAAERAAAFIAAEFAEVELATLAGDEDYLQSFPVYSLALESASVTLNGAAVPEERVAVSLGDEALEWSTGNGVEIMAVGPGDDAMGALRAMRGGGDRLIVMDPSHEQAFERIRGFVSRGSRSLDAQPRGSTVIVLAAAPEVRELAVRATGTREAEEIANVVGVVPGRRSDEIVVFSGHYDHIGIVEPVDGDAIANGANDDASGTTAMIELARYFAAQRQPERTLVFIAFVAEEMGGYGSRYFSEQLDPDQIVAMFNIEMIGKPSGRGPNAAWVTGFERSDFGAILQGAAEGTGYEFFADPYPDQNLFYRSDNATLARLGVPAHSISTTPIDVDPDYHQVSDEIETLDLEHMTATIRAIATAAAPIIDGTATPTRIDPASLR